MIDAEQRRRQVLIVGLAMVASLWVHILGLALWRYLPPLPTPPSNPPVLVELEFPSEPEPAPEPQSAPEDRTSPPAAAKAPDDDLEEETISLESKAPQYLSYLGQVKVRIRNHWIFPPKAREKLEFGRLVAVFTLDRDGNLLRIVVEQSSGHELLDHAALEAVRGAVPFPPFPEHINLKRLNIRAYFDYRVRYLNVQ